MISKEAGDETALDVADDSAMNAADAIPPAIEEYVSEYPKLFANWKAIRIPGFHVEALLDGLNAIVSTDGKDVFTLPKQTTYRWFDVLPLLDSLFLLDRSVADFDEANNTIHDFDPELLADAKSISLFVDQLAALMEDDALMNYLISNGEPDMGV
jgi:hypothetical protein